MKNKKIIIPGGSGFIGQEIAKYFVKENEIVILTREIRNEKNNRNYYSTLTQNDLSRIRFVKWDGRTPGEWTKELNNADIVINLAGKTVNCKYNSKNKKEIIDSRINATKVIGQTIQNCSNPPTLWINASSATIYRHAEDRPQDEYTGELHDDFSVRVCKIWEKTFYEQVIPRTRKIALRMAITFGPGGILIPYFNLLKFGLGGQQGNGRQMFSWIHIEDTCRIIEWLFDHTEMNGTYNCAAPNPVPNKKFIKALRTATGCNIGLPAFTWMLKAGAVLIGTETELILKSRWVTPTKILESGFQFKFPEINEALEDIIKQVPKKQYRLF